MVGKSDAAAQLGNGDWKMCRRGSCHRNERCMYTECKPATMPVNHADTAVDPQTTKLGPAAQKIADGLNDAIEGRYQTTKERSQW